MVLCIHSQGKEAIKESKKNNYFLVQVIFIMPLNMVGRKH